MREKGEKRRNIPIERWMKREGGERWGGAAGKRVREKGKKRRN